MAHRSQCSSAGDNPLDPNYLPPHYREEYRLAVDALVEENLEGYYGFLQSADVVDFLSRTEIEYIRSTLSVPRESLLLQPEQQQQQQQRYLEGCGVAVAGGDGSSSDTYWPIHSDVDAPGLDLGWPHMHRFVGPTEVTTLVNPAEPDMPTIKEQARRLIKNAQQVVAIVMDMFTDVDIFADVINATMRNVAVYILLDELNVHHFVNMLSNCRVNLESIQFLRVRTVSGITYHCRSGKTFKGQMMDRFLLTDCRAVLSGNYSFMWSFEKLHRCLAHLFLGQLVSTFDEEFRILYAQSQPLSVQHVLARMENFGMHDAPEGQYVAGDNPPPYKDPRIMSLVPPREPSCPDEWKRQPFDDRVAVDMQDWNKGVPLSRHDSIPRSRVDPPPPPVDMYMYPPQQQQLRGVDQPYEQQGGHSRMPANVKDSPTFKRHSFAEGCPPGRHPYQLIQQQGLPGFEPTTEGKRFHRDPQHPFPRTGPETGYSGLDKFRGPGGYHPSDQYSESGLPQDLELDSFDPVLNYLTSTSNVEMDEVSVDRLSSHTGEVPSGEVPSHPRRLNAGQPYACQKSPTASNQPDQKMFFEEPNVVDRKDPKVKQGLRNWRICSYLSAYDEPGDKELPRGASPAPDDPFEESPYSSSSSAQRRSSAAELSSLQKIPNTRVFKVPPVPMRASQLPGYTKPETKRTPTPSESSSTATDKSEEPVEPRDTVVRRESFRRQVNPAVQRSSRLRSSLIFSSQLEQQDSQTASGQDEETDKSEGDVSKLPFASRVLGQRRSFAKEPFEWTRYARPATFDSPNTDATKSDDIKDLTSEKRSQDLPDTTPSSKAAEGGPAKMSPSASQPDVSKMEPHASVMSDLSYMDMNDPDNRLMFFKELAAKRKAEKAATTKPPPESKTAPAACGEDSAVASTDSEKIELKNNQASCCPSSKPPLSHSQSFEEPKPSGPVAVKEHVPFHLPTVSVPTLTDPTTTHRTDTNERPVPGATLKDTSSPKQAELASPSKSGTLASSLQQLGPSESLYYPDKTEPLEGEPVKISASQPDLSHEVSPQIDNPVVHPPPTSLMSNLSLSNLSYVDMNDPDSRLMFFKELAAKRKVAMAAAAAPNSTERSVTKPPPPESKTCKAAEPDVGEDLRDLPGSPVKKPAVLHEASAGRNATTLPEVVSASPAKTRGPVDDSNAREKDKNPPKNHTVTSVALSPNSASRSTPLRSLSSRIDPSDSGSTPPRRATQSCDGPLIPETNTAEPNESLDPSALEPSPSPPNQSPRGSAVTQAVLSSTEVQPDSVIITPHTSSESPSALASPHADSAPSDGPENDSGPPTTATVQSAAEPGCGESLTAKPKRSKASSCSVPPSPKDGKDKCSAPLSLSHVVVSSDLPHTKSSTDPDRSPVDIKGGSSPHSVEPHPGDTPASTGSSVESVTPSQSKSVTPPHRRPSAASVPVENNNDLDNQCDVSLKDLKQNKSSVLETSISSPKHSQKEPDLTLKGHSAELSGTVPAESCSIFSPADDSDSVPPVASPPSEPHTLRTLTLRHARIPCELTSAAYVSPASAATPVSCSSPPPGSGGSAPMSPKPPKLRKVEPAVTSLSKHAPKDSDKSTADISEESSSDPSPIKPSSEVTTDLTEPRVESEMPAESKSVPSAYQQSEASIPVGNNNMDDQCEVRKQPEQIESAAAAAEIEPGDAEATNVNNRTVPQESAGHGQPNSQTREKRNSETETESVVPPSPQSKQPKPATRYHSSTANVISSSNLRDDTKLLLGQISANSQSRGGPEPASEFDADTDDYKEEEADKHMRMEKESVGRSLRRGRPKSAQEREKLLEKIQSMRKERKVYSRFEMAP